MFSNPISFVLIYIIGSIIALFLTGVIIKRSEKCVEAFYSPLREKYKKSYFKQNKIIKFIRKLYKMDTRNTIHWGYCIYHYIENCYYYNYCCWSFGNKDYSTITRFRCRKIRGIS